MLQVQAAFSGISVDDLTQAEDFYTKTMGLELDSKAMGLQFRLPGGGKLFVYDKPNHQPATFTVLNFVVSDIDAAVEELHSHGISFEHYNMEDGPKMDEKDIVRGRASGMGPDIAWFKDPAGNILSVLQDS